MICSNMRIQVGDDVIPEAPLCSSDVLIQCSNDYVVFVTDNKPEDCQRDGQMCSYEAGVDG